MQLLKLDVGERCIFVYILLRRPSSNFGIPNFALRLSSTIALLCCFLFFSKPWRNIMQELNWSDWARQKCTRQSASFWSEGLAHWTPLLAATSLFAPTGGWPKQATIMSHLKDRNFKDWLRERNLFTFPLAPCCYTHRWTTCHPPISTFEHILSCL